MTHRLISSLACLLLLMSAACSNYDYTFNDRVVYTPGPLFTDFDIPDAALNECVRQAINDNKVTVASQLFKLACTGAGVSNLAGLATFTGIEQLTLSSNRISDISELGALTVLQVLYLDNNQVIDPVPLFQLPALNLVDLSGNPDLRCPSTSSLMRISNISLPRHCS